MAARRRRYVGPRSDSGRVPLFDRLADDALHTPREPHPHRWHDRAGLEASLQAEISQLLNTRRGPALERPGLAGTVLSYGVPDHILDSPGSTRAQESLVADIEAAIKRFEPRLRDVRVSVGEPLPRQQALTLSISGEVELAGDRLAVRFPVVIGGWNANE